MYFRTSLDFVTILLAYFSSLFAFLIFLDQYMAAGNVDFRSIDNTLESAATLINAFYCILIIIKTVRLYGSRRHTSGYAFLFAGIASIFTSGAILAYFLVNKFLLSVLFSIVLIVVYTSRGRYAVYFQIILDMNLYPKNPFRVYKPGRQVIYRCDPITKT